MEEFDVQFDACAFDLKPGLPPEGMPRKQVYAGRVYPDGYIDNLLQTARGASIEMKRPPIIPNTRKAHEATEFARDANRLLEFHRAVFHAYWVEELNIGDVDVLCAIAAGCGLDAEALRSALADGRSAARVGEQMAWTKAVGVTGVPTTIFDERFAVVGAQEYELFRDVAKRVMGGRLT